MLPMAAGGESYQTAHDQLLADEQQARRRAEDVADRLTRLQSLTEGLAGAVTTDGVLDAVLAAALGSLGMASVTVCLVEGDALAIAAAAGLSAENKKRYARFPLASDLPMSVVVRNGEPTFFTS